MSDDEARENDHEATDPEESREAPAAPAATASGESDHDSEESREAPAAPAATASGESDHDSEESREAPAAPAATASGESDHDSEESREAPAAPAATASGESDHDHVAGAIVERFPGSVFFESHGQPVVYVDRAVFAEVATFLRDEQQFMMLADITAVDHLLDGARATPDAVAGERFEVVANYLSHTRNRRIRVICQLPEADPTVPSLTPVYPGANFPERETYDLFGITFDGHPDLTRILMPDDWEGHPLRKDFPPARVPVTFKGDPSPR